jgi:alkylresorcinol/alkylpyrone synthase
MGQQGPRLVASCSKTIPGYRDDVRYIYKRGRLHNQLSSRLPEVVEEHVPVLVKSFLEKQHLAFADIRHWAIHPGGDKMLGRLQHAFGLTDNQMAPTRSILSRYGNMSSPTVLFELETIMDECCDPGDKCLIITFGAGFAIHSYLLEF